MTSNDELPRHPEYTRGDWSPVAGPADRVSFFEEQARHRRATWQIALLCLLAILATAFPYSAIIGPLVYGIVVLALRLAQLVMPVPDSVWIPFRLAYVSMDRLIERLDTMTPQEIPGAVLTVLILLTPGVLAVFLTWAWLRLTLHADGVGGALLQLGARDPISTDLEERQLQNVLEEMAVAAGLANPRLQLIDTPVANAAVMGTGPSDATIIVSRRLLDELDRDETQAVLAHLIGAVGNGDLRIGMRIVALYQTLGLMSTVLDLPVSGDARRSFWKLIRALLPGQKNGSSSAALIISHLLGESMGDLRMSEINRILDDPERPGLNRFWKIVLGAKRIILIPPMLMSLFGKMVLTVMGSILMGPPIAMAWRTRRYLADATAVQLTRNPDALAGALRSLAEKGGLIAGGRWAEHLFIVGAEAASSARAAARMEQLRTMRTKLRGGSVNEGLAAAQFFHEAESETTKDTFAEQNLLMVSMHPSIASRVQRVVAQGATDTPAGRSNRRGFWGMGALGILIIVPLLALCVVLLAIAIGLMTMLTLLVFEIGMFIVLGAMVPNSGLGTS